ncbi:hypothetical protein ES703_113461 [subsurface metagenome]
MSRGIIVTQYLIIEYESNKNYVDTILNNNYIDIILNPEQCQMRYA